MCEQGGLSLSLSLSSLPGVEAAAELPAGGTEGEGESLGLHTQPAAATDRLPQAGEHVSPGRGADPTSGPFTQRKKGHNNPRCKVTQSRLGTFCLLLPDPHVGKAPPQCLEEKPCQCREGQRKSQNTGEQCVICDQRSEICCKHVYSARYVLCYVCLWNGSILNYSFNQSDQCDRFVLTLD